MHLSALDALVLCLQLPESMTMVSTTFGMLRIGGSVLDPEVRPQFNSYGECSSDIDSARSPQFPEFSNKTLSVSFGM